MKRRALLEAITKLTVLKTTPYRDRPGGVVVLQIPGNTRDIEASWYVSSDGDEATLHMRPYPDGWVELSATEQLEALKEILVVIHMHNLKTPKKPPPKRKRRG